MPSAWMRTVWVTPRHSRTSRVPGLKEIGGAGVTEPRFESLSAPRSGTSDALFPEEVQSFPDNFFARLGHGSVDDAGSRMQT